MAQMAAKQQEEMKKQQQMESLKKLEEMRRQQHLQQQELQRQQLEDNRKKLEEANQRRLEEQRKRMEEVRRQQEELRKRQEEERARREQEAAQKREEQRAALSIRRVLQRVRSANPENFEELKRELEEVLQKELESCATQASRMRQEADQGLEQAKQRIELIKEQQKRVEEQRLEMERKRKEAQERAEQLLAELDKLVTEAEGAAKTLKEEAEPLSGDKDFKLDEILATAKAVDEAGQEAKDKMKACTDFILSKGPEMRTQDVPGQPSSETKQTLAKLLQRINECTRGTEAMLASSKALKDKAVKKAEARKKEDLTRALFDKYDADRDGMLNRKEALRYAKGEFDFVVPNSAIDAIFKVLVEDGEKGVKKDLFQRFRVAVGIAREKAKDAERKAAREAREKKLAEMKAELQDRLKDAGKVVESTGELVDKAEEGAVPLPAKSKALASAEMLRLADEADEAIKEARDEVAGARKELSDLAEGVDTELQPWLTGELRKLEAVVARYEPRLARAAGTSARFREDARRKEADELYALEREALAVIKYHQRAKKLTSDGLFADIDASKDGRIDEREFLDFFGRCAREPKVAEAKAGEEGQQAQAEGGREEETPGPPREDLSRLFACLDEDGEGYISKDKFTNLVRVFMKVAKDTVITSGISIKESKTLRRLEVGEIVEILEGPIKEDKVDVMRVHAKVMKDELEGWITLAGNQGTVFLEEGGNLFKVVKETILTESFELDGGGSKDATRKLKDTTRKLKEGEIVEVREWARKEEKSGLLRMKCKVKSDGEVGWVTTVGNQGTVFLEPA